MVELGMCTLYVVAHGNFIIPLLVITIQVQYAV